MKDELKELLDTYIEKTKELDKAAQEYIKAKEDHKVKLVEFKEIVLEAISSVSPVVQQQILTKLKEKKQKREEG